MSMTKAKLMDAFRDAACAEFEEYLPYGSDYSYEFSERFERRMDRLVKSESRATWRFVNTNPKRLIIIALAILVTSFAVACAVPEIRESIAGFFVRVLSTHDEISTPESMRQIIEDEYVLTEIPEGFRLATKNRSSDIVTSEYTNQNNDYIQLIQIARIEVEFGSDNQQAEKSELYACGKKILVYSIEGSCYAFWTEDNYLFNLNCSFCVDIKTLESWIGSIKPIA